MLAAVLVLGFGWLRLRGIDLLPLTTEIPASVLFRFTLTLYFMSWVAGSISDVDEQAIVYTSASNKGKLPWV